MAASSLILAINIYMVQNELKEGKSDQDPSSFFYIRPQDLHQLQRSSDKRILNTNVWNNFLVSSQTGFSMEMLKPCLFDLARFIEEYLEPNKLKYFDIDAIKQLKNKLEDSGLDEAVHSGKPICLNYKGP